jgi:hypothetical protein
MTFLYGTHQTFIIQGFLILTIQKYFCEHDLVHPEAVFPRSQYKRSKLHIGEIPFFTYICNL